MTVQEKAKYFIAHPVQLGWALGYEDLREDLHGVWMRQMLTATDDMTLQAHRGSFKTTCLGIVIALLMIKERDKNIIFLRKTDADIAEVVTNINRIMVAPVFQEMFVALTGQKLELVKATGSEITTNIYSAPRGAAQLMGIGIGGSLTGKHADIIITDDIINLKDRQSRAERDRTKSVYQELQNVKNPTGRIINCGTPWHKEDAFELMPEPMQYNVYQTGILDDEQIADLRKKMSPSLFAANYELKHIASENALFELPPVFYEQQYDDLGEAVNPVRDGIAHVDAAYGGEDWTAFTCGKRVGDKLYMFGQMWHCHVDVVIDRIIALSQRYMCSPIYCETNADKGFLAKEIRRKNPNLPIRVYHEDVPKYQKIAEYLRKWWTDIVWSPETDREYINQIMDYTEDAEHDDAPDSAACVCRLLDKKMSGHYNPILGGQRQERGRI